MAGTVSLAHNKNKFRFEGVMIKKMIKQQQQQQHSGPMYKKNNASTNIQDHLHQALDLSTRVYSLLYV